MDISVTPGSSSNKMFTYTVGLLKHGFQICSVLEQKTHLFALRNTPTFRKTSLFENVITYCTFTHRAAECSSDMFSLFLRQDMCTSGFDGQLGKFFDGIGYIGEGFGRHNHLFNFFICLLEAHCFIISAKNKNNI